GEVVVLDGFSKPSGVVAAMQVEEPGVVVDAVGELQEQDQVLRAQVQRVVGPAEVEAPVFGQLAFGVLARVPLVALLRAIGSQPARGTVALALPEQHSSACGDIWSGWTVT